MPVRNARRLKIARVGTSVPAPIDPDGDEVLRTASSGFADRALEDVALAALRVLRFSPVGHPVPTLGEPDPRSRTMRLGDLSASSRGAEFGAMASGVRTDGTG